MYADTSRFIRPPRRFVGRRQHRAAALRATAKRRDSSGLDAGSTTALAVLPPWAQSRRRLMRPAWPAARWRRSCSASQAMASGGTPRASNSSLRLAPLVAAPGRCAR